MDLPKHPCVEWLRAYARAHPGPRFVLPANLVAKVEQEFAIEKVPSVRELLVVQLYALSDEVRVRGATALAQQLEELVNRFAGKQCVSIKRDERQAAIEAKAEAARRARALLGTDVAASPLDAGGATETRRGTVSAATLVPRMIRG